MDDDIIRELYFGNLNPSDRSMPLNSPLGRACRTFCDAENTLRERLSETDRETLQTLLKTHSDKETQ